MQLAIEWDEADARRGRHKASTIHGWLCKMRGTIIGNERIRREGRYEMKEARARRTYMRQRSKQQGKGGGFPLFGLLGGGNRRRPSSSRKHAVTLPRHGSHHSQRKMGSTTALVPYAQKQAHAHSRRQSERRKDGKSGGGGSRHNARPEPQRHRSQTQTRPQQPGRKSSTRK